MSRRFALLSLTVLFAAPALAYVPPSQFIVRMIAKKHESAKAIRIRSIVTELEDDKPGKAHFKQVSIYDPARGILKSRAFDDAGQELYAVERRYGDAATTNPVVLKPGDAGPASGPLLLASNPDTVSQILLSVGIPVRTEAELVAMKDEEERRASEITTLGRWKNQVAWLVGPGVAGENPPRKPEPGAAPSPQLWILKDSFVPMRLFTAAEEGSNEIRFENFRYVREFPFPRVITAVRHRTGKEQSVLREEVSEFSVTSDTSELKAHVTLGYTDAGNSADSAVRELIRSYFATVR